MPLELQGVYKLNPLHRVRVELQHRAQRRVRRQAAARRGRLSGSLTARRFGHISTPECGVGWAGHRLSGHGRRLARTPHPASPCSQQCELPFHARDPTCYPRWKAVDARTPAAAAPTLAATATATISNHASAASSPRPTPCTIAATASASASCAVTFRRGAFSAAPVAFTAAPVTFSTAAPASAAARPEHASDGQPEAQLQR